MGRQYGDSSDGSEWAEHGLVCPRCTGTVDRIERQFGDRIVSLFVPVRRYQCRGCGWEGALRHARSSATKHTTAQTPGSSGR